MSLEMDSGCRRNVAALQSKEEPSSFLDILATTRCAWRRFSAFL